MKIEWLIADVITVGSPHRKERDILGMILGLCSPIHAAIVAREPLCDLGIFS